MGKRFHLRQELIVSVLLMMWLVRAAISDEKATSAQGSGTNQTPVRLLSAPPAQEQKGLLSEPGMRHSRIATDRAYFYPSNSTSGLNFRLIPIFPSPIADPATERQRLARTKDAAEMINAQCMREYQRRFERHLANPQALAVPALYPTLVQKRLEEIR